MKKNKFRGTAFDFDSNAAAETKFRKDSSTTSDKNKSKRPGADLGTTITTRRDDLSNTRMGRLSMPLLQHCAIIFLFTFLPRMASGAICSVTNGSATNDQTCMCGNVECTADTGLICYAATGGGSCRKNDPGAFGYPTPNHGRCTDVEGRAWIFDKASCEAAATSLGFSGLSDTTVSHSDLAKSYAYIPPGCYYENGHLNYNVMIPRYVLGRSQSTNCGQYASFCLCMSAPNCGNTNGTVANDAPCLCGETGCTATTGFYCHESLDFCSMESSCPISDGSAENINACKCGNVVCTLAMPDTGMVCDTRLGAGTCQKGGL